MTLSRLRPRAEPPAQATTDRASRAAATGLRVVFAIPAYRRLWAARTVSQCGDVANTVALGLLVLQLTGSGFGVAGVVAAEIIPVLLLAPSPA